MAPIVAERVIPSGPATIFAFLADLRRHWELLPDAVDVEDATATGAIVHVRGPLGVRRTLHTQVTEVRAPAELVGLATGDATAKVSWSLSAEGTGTRVRLSVEVQRAPFADRLLLAGGGAVWLQRRLATALGRLEAAVQAAPVERAA